MFYFIIIIWVIIDLFTKNLAYKYLQNQVDILWDFLYLQYAENTWVAFSTQIFGLKYLTILLIIGVFYYYFLEKKNINIPFNSNEIAEEVRIWNLVLLDLSFWLILAWAIWNWIERVFNWNVIDFIGVKYFSVFNLADSFITVWVIIYLYILFKNKK
jgi:signal peptidase II